MSCCQPCSCNWQHCSLASLLLLFINLLFYLTAFASPYWLWSTGGEDLPTPTGYHFGLWITCYEVVANDSSAENTWTCETSHDWIYITHYGGWQTAWLDGLQAMAAVALIFCFTSTTVFTVYTFAASKLRPDVAVGLVYISSLAAFANACFLFITLLICGTKPQQDDAIVFKATLDWSFYLAAVAEIFILVAFIMTFVEFAYRVKHVPPIYRARNTAVKPLTIPLRRTSSHSTSQNDDTSGGHTELSRSRIRHPVY